MNLRRTWGYASAVFHRPRLGWTDLLLTVALAGVVFAVVDLGHEWKGKTQVVKIDLAPWALVEYTLFSLSRGLLAYLLSLTFTFLYGYWAAKDRLAERILIPLLDILQSIPVLGFMPGVVLALVALFPGSNVGLELAAIIMIFTAQVWNMTFSFYNSLRSIPPEQREVAAIYRFDWWQRVKWLEVPSAMLGLVWNSMVSMAGGWFFLMINESFRLGDKDFRLPGIGSYMSAAVEAGRVDAMLWAIVAMTLMILALDQLLWRPLVVWAQRFRGDEGGTQVVMTSWFLDLLRRSQVAALIERVKSAVARMSQRRGRKTKIPAPPVAASHGATWVTRILFAVLLVTLGYCAWRLVQLVSAVSLSQWGTTFAAAGWTLTRVLGATAIGTLWTLPAGLAIGLSPKLSRIMQPVVQVVASFPAPMLFPLVIAAATGFGASLGWVSIVLMLLGTQWYILFNVVAGAMAIPADLREAARSYRFSLWQSAWYLYIPAVFPYLVTGWVTAAGGAWNASIVAEYVTFHGTVLQTQGLGAQISAAAEQADFPLLAASIVTMSTVVVIFNRAVWRRCYKLAQGRFSLSK